VRVKLTNTEGLRQEVEVSLGDREKKLKEALQERKTLEEKLGDLQLQLSTAQKRIEFR